MFYNRSDEDFDSELCRPGLYHEALLRLFYFRSYMEIAVHIEADDAEVVRAGHVGDDALSAFPLLRHSHPHVPVPQLRDTKHPQFTTFPKQPHTHWKDHAGGSCFISLTMTCVYFMLILHTHCWQFSKLYHHSLDLSATGFSFRHLKQAAGR